MAFPLAPLIGALAGPIIGGLLGKSADEQKQVTERTETKSQEPWAPVQPYILGGGPIPQYLTGQPDLTRQFIDWAQASGTGANLDAPPPMLFDSIRNQLGIGIPGGQNPEFNRVSAQPPAAPAQPQQTGQTPQAPAIDPRIQQLWNQYQLDQAWANDPTHGMD